MQHYDWNSEKKEVKVTFSYTPYFPRAEKTKTSTSTSTETGKDSVGKEGEKEGEKEGGKEKEGEKQEGKKEEKEEKEGGKKERRRSSFTISPQERDPPALSTTTFMNMKAVMHNPPLNTHWYITPKVRGGMYASA